MLSMAYDASIILGVAIVAVWAGRGWIDVFVIYTVMYIIIFTYRIHRKYRDEYI